MHPLNTTATSGRFLEPKNGRLRTITLHNFSGIWDRKLGDVREGLLKLPRTFTKDPMLGWGSSLIHDMVSALEEIDGVTDLRVVSGRSDGLPKLDGSSYVISRMLLDDIRKKLRRIHDTALRNAAARRTRLFSISSLEFLIQRRILLRCLNIVRAPF